MATETGIGRPAVLVARGLRRRCPRCGSTGLFVSWLTMADRCPACALTLDRGDAFFLGGFVINFGVTEIVLGIVIAILVVGGQPDPHLPLIAAAAAAVTVIVPLVFYPFSKTIWLAIEMIMRPPSLADGEGGPARRADG